MRVWLRTDFIDGIEGLAGALVLVIIIRLAVGL